MFIVLGDVGGRLQGKVRLLQLVLRHRHLHRDVVRLRELLLRLEVADDEGHQVGRHLFCHMELVSHLATNNICQNEDRGRGKRVRGVKEDKNSNTMQFSVTVDTIVHIEPFHSEPESLACIWPGGNTFEHWWSNLTEEMKVQGQSDWKRWKQKENLEERSAVCVC